MQYVGYNTPDFQLTLSTRIPQAGLETTATFDQRSDEFVIHTPHIVSNRNFIQLHCLL